MLTTRVERFLAAALTGRLRALDVQVHDNRILPASHYYCFTRHIRAGVDLLMRDVGRHIDEISGVGLIAKL